VGSEQYVRKLEVSNKVYTVHLHDTSGNERNSGLSRTYFRNSNINLIVFDLGHPESLNSAQQWINLAKQFSPTAILALVANKADSPSTIEKEEINSFAQSQDIRHIYYVSAKTGEGIHKLIVDLVARAV